MEYCYHKNLKKWENCDSRLDEVPKIALEKLKSSKTRSTEFIKTKVKYANCSYRDVSNMYNDISDFAFFLNNDRIVLMWSGSHSKTTRIFNSNEIISKKTYNKLKFLENPEKAREFIISRIRDYYFDFNNSNLVGNFALANDLAKKNYIRCMSDSLKLYFEINPITEAEVLFK